MREQRAFTYTGTSTNTPTANLKYQYRLDNGAYSTPATATTATLNALADGPHTFQVAAVDQYGYADPNPATRHFTIDGTLPVISNVQSGGATDSAIGILWQTNKATTSQVKYRIAGTTNFDSTSLNTNAVTTHQVAIYGLKPATNYQYYVVSQDSCGNAVDTSATLGTFATTPDISKPNVGFTIAPPNGGSVGPGNVVFAWQAHDDATPDDGLTYQYQLDNSAWMPATPANIITVTLNFPTIAPNAHTFRVQAFDASGNISAPASVTFTVDGTAPVFIALNASNITFNSTQIHWTTDKPTTGQVQYDAGNGNFDFHFDYPGLSTTNGLTIGPLGSKTTYRVRVIATDAAGNTTTAGPITLTTLPVHDLAVSPGDLSFSNPGPASGDTITMSAKIHNLGDFDETATVVFYDVTPNGGSREIGRVPVTAPTRAAQAPVVTSPPFTVLEGPHLPYALLINASPADDITGNNAAQTNLAVGAPACRFALSVTTPATYPGDNSLFTVNLTNTGSQPQTLANVSLTGTAWVTLVSPVPTTPIAPNQSIQLTYRMAPPTTQPGGPINNPVLLPMTVSASCGQSFSQNFNIAVYTNAVCELDITVFSTVKNDRGENVPIVGATIALDYTDRQYFTGPNGTPIDNSGAPVKIYAPSGSHAVFAIAKNYLPVSYTVDCSQSVAKAELYLQPGQALQVSQVTVTPLTPTEIAKRGVNLADPQNYNIFDFVLTMRIGPLPVPNVQLPITPVTPGTCICQTYPIGGGGIGGFGGGSVTLSAYYPTPDPTIHVDTWIIIPGDIRVLKQFFDATVFVQNNTSFPINSVVANLTLPTGLSLPDLLNAPQSLSETIGTIPAQGKAQASWVLRGDLPGTYTVTGSASGKLQLGAGNPIDLTSSLTSGAFTVSAPKIGVAFGTPSAVYAGKDFPIDIIITNKSPIDLNGVRVHIKADKLVNCTLSSNQPYRTQNPDPVYPNDPTMFYVGTIAVGQTVTVRINFTSLVTGIVEEVQSYVSDPFAEPSITVTPKPILPPVAVSDTIATDKNTAYTALVLANDHDTNTPALPLVVSSFTTPAHGTVTKNADNSLTYTPANNYTGPDSFTYTASNGTLTASAAVYVTVGKVVVSGTVNLLDCLVPVGQVIMLEFRPIDGAAKFTRTAILDANSHFSVSDIPARQYNLAIKGTKWLRRVVNVDASSGANLSNITASLVNGDANNDNKIDIADFGVLVNAYTGDVSIPGSGYDVNADFNCDGTVDIADFGILVNNYNQSGAP